MPANRKIIHSLLRHHIFEDNIPSFIVLNDSEKRSRIDEIVDTLSQFRTHKFTINIDDFVTAHTNTKVTYLNIINQDKPFLFDSIMNVIQSLNLKVGMATHPVLTFCEGPKNTLGNVIDTQSEVTKNNPHIRVSVIHVEFLRALSATQKAALKKELNQTLTYVTYAVNDWQAMRQRTILAKDEVAALDHHFINASERDEAVAFLQWMLDNHFTFLGMREFSISQGKKLDIKTDNTNSLGILRDKDFRILKQKDKATYITPEIEKFYNLPTPLIITKANTRSLVHRAVHLDYVGLKRYNEKGDLIGELRIVGLFTSSAYDQAVEHIPVLRRKTFFALTKLQLERDSHAGKLFAHIINDFPRDELFQIDAETVVDSVRKIMSLDMLPCVEVLDRHDEFERFVSVLVYIPKKDYSVDNEKRIAQLIATAFAGRISAINSSHPEGHMVRLHYIIGRDDQKLKKACIENIKKDISHLLLDFNELVSDLLSTHMPKNHVATLQNKYKSAFCESYQGVYDGKQAIEDIQCIEKAYNEHGFSTHFYKNAEGQIALRIYAINNPVSLSQRVPILENFGFNVISEHSFIITSEVKDKVENVYLYDMHLMHPFIDLSDNPALSKHFEECYEAIWLEKTENDSYNYLVSKANFNWHEAALFRAFGRYLRQAGLRFEQEDVAKALYSHHTITQCILDLFHLRFNPKTNRQNLESKQTHITKKIDILLEEVTSLNDDIIFRRIICLVKGIQRTNFFTKKETDQYNDVISFKISARELDFLPEPRPFAEIFVSSPRVEGVHLRFGSIARGGLRWSDRYSDFRTEVLGLVKAQQVKNAVIVPVGAKGGFVPKKLPAASDREAFIKEGIASYRIFISSLLQLSDNLVNNKVVPPKNVVRHDGDDAYLVVAADKGTATFSDIANGISQEHNFWLSDAFASGGSAGYDHKKMGITAKGGWESVKRHFREMNRDIQKQDFTAIGVGDMSGDVFGNGMLLSPHTQLRAAFDHRDIFIDPSPDTQISFAERSRLFKLGRSSWQDYNKDCMSKGGAIYKRTDKSLTLTPEIKKMLNIKQETLTPNELIHIILRMPIDLLWFGGIGTYIRAESETHMDVGDHANDPIRIYAKELQAKVVGEGANLGMTQRARIEFSKCGGRINTDAVDNSAGVNSSDLEVNIKIAFGQAVEKNKITITERNRILSKMTTSVSKLVLKNNYEQTLCLSLAEKNAVRDLPFQIAFIRNLENRKLLNREVEFLPTDSEMETLIADNRGLTRPELSVLIAYAKITLFDEILECGITENPFLEKDLLAYFPIDMQKKFSDEILTHKLKNEIVATILSNHVINNCGPTIIQRLKDETGCNTVDIIKAYIIANNAFNFETIRNNIHRLDNKIDGKQQLDIYANLQTQLNNVIVWLLFNEDMSRDLNTLIIDYANAWQQGHSALITKIRKCIPNTVTSSNTYTDIPKELNMQLASITHAVKLCDIALTSRKTQKTISQTLNTYIDIGNESSLIALIDSADTLSSGGYYEKLATDKMVNLLRCQLRSMTIQAQKQGEGRKWIRNNQPALQKARNQSNRALADGLLTLAEIVTLTSNYDKLAG